jgi:hypothetical protein
MTKRLETLYAAVLAGSLLLSGAGGANVLAGDNHRGKSGLRHGAGNSNAALQNHVNKIKKDIKVVDSEIDSLRNDIKVMNGEIGSLTAHVEALETVAPPELLWINHLDFFVDAASGLSASFVANPLGGWSGLVIRAARAVADQIIVAGLQVPPRYNVTKVRICYELSSAASFITHIKITQLTSPSSGIEVLTDLNDKTNVTAICADSAPAAEPISPSNGPLRLNLGATFANPADLIVIRAVGLHLEPAI